MPKSNPKVRRVKDKKPRYASKRYATLSIQFLRKEDCLQMILTHNDQNDNTWSHWEGIDAYKFGLDLAKSVQGDGELAEYRVFIMELCRSFCSNVTTLPLPTKKTE